MGTSPLPGSRAGSQRPAKAKSPPVASRMSRAGGCLPVALLPLVEARRGDEAAAPREGVAERRLVAAVSARALMSRARSPSDRAARAPSVSEARRAPAGCGSTPTTAHRLGGGDVVAGRELGRLVEAEGLGHLLAGLVRVKRPHIGPGARLPGDGAAAARARARPCSRSSGGRSTIARAASAARRRSRATCCGAPWSTGSSSIWLKSQS